MCIFERCRSDWGGTHRADRLSENFDDVKNRIKRLWTMLEELPNDTKEKKKKTREIKTSAISNPRKTKRSRVKGLIIILYCLLSSALSIVTISVKYRFHQKLLQCWEDVAGLA